MPRPFAPRWGPNCRCGCLEGVSITFHVLLIFVKLDPHSSMELLDVMDTLLCSFAGDYLSLRGLVESPPRAERDLVVVPWTAHTRAVFADILDVREQEWTSHVVARGIDGVQPPTSAHKS
mmetsp:Transcript_131/g.446  ORF Transcript_131/g.446 Transcript_131/m.446 type:complete len:120 (-) Transcript_131:757-1116(-)